VGARGRYGRRMRVGLTGGVGSGKSTVAALLAGHGAVVIDADAIAREVVEPGTPGYQAVVARFGPDVVRADGSLDRPALAAVVFADEAARADLNAIVHPLVGQRSAELMAVAGADDLVVYDVPLLVESGLGAAFDVVVVVEAAVETRLARLVERGLAEADARARMAAQATDEQRRAVAHEVIANDGSRAELAAEVEELWRRLRARQDADRDRDGC
jgi:dephospho-CoA kinase